MLTSSRKSKGRNLQKLVVKKILEMFPLSADDVTSRSMGAAGEDVLMSLAARQVLPMSIECKRRASMAVYKDYDQAQANSGGWEPVLVIQADRSKPLVVCDLDYFLRMHK